MKNIGGYDENSFYDSNGIAFLIRFLQQKHNIKALLGTDDKIPNLDGTIQLLEKSDKKNIPTQIFHVQVKTINSNYINDNLQINKSQYKYSAETKVFNIVKENITLDPVLLFLVDEKNEKVFCVYVSIEYVMTLQLNNENYKMIYFNDCDQITDFDKFILNLKFIHKQKIFLLNHGDENKITTDKEISIEEYEMLQSEWAFLDDLLSNKMKIMKTSLYPGAWKFGIAYNTSNDFNIIGIYQIKRGEKGEYIKVFSNDENDCFAISKYNKDKIDLHSILINQIERLAKKYYESFYINPSSLSTIVLEEIVFDFLDNMAKAYPEYESPIHKCIYYKNVESIKEIRKIWNALLRFAINQNKNILEQFANTPNVVAEINPLASLLSCAVKYKESTIATYKKILSVKNSIVYELPYPLIFSKKYNYQLVHESIYELEKRLIKIITRPWRPKKYIEMFKQYEKLRLAGFDRIETGFLIEDIYFNGKKMLEQLTDAYKYSVDRIWEKDSKYHQIEREYSFCFNDKDIDGRLIVLVRNANKFKIIINEYLLKDLLESINVEITKLSDFNAQKVIFSDFYKSATLQTP